MRAAGWSRDGRTEAEIGGQGRNASAGASPDPPMAGELGGGPIRFGA